MSDLDDFDLQKVPESAGDGRDRRSLRRSLLGAVALLAVGIAAITYVARRYPRTLPTPGPSAAPTPSAAPSPSPTSGAALPPLDQSDVFVRGLAKGLSAHPQVAAWLASQGLVRTLTVVVENIADGETPAPHLRFLAPKQGFRATPKRGRQIIDPRSYEGYGAFADGVASLDAAGCARVYRLLEPLFDAAYRDLGHPEGGFSKAMDRALAALVDVAVLEGDVPVVPSVRAVVVYEFADKRLEALTPAQKQLLRMGPDNVRKIQAKLREIRQALRTSRSP